MPIFRRSKTDSPQLTIDDVLWGVARREGHSDTDDPLVHQRLVQHAFPFGDDERAVCGFKPPKRTSRADDEPRPQLALAGPDNPRCPKCLALLLPAAGPADAIDTQQTGDQEAEAPTATSVAAQDAEEAEAEDAEDTEAEAEPEPPPDAEASADDEPSEDAVGDEQIGAAEVAPRHSEWSPRSGMTAEDDAGDGQDEGATVRNRTSARRGGRVNVPAGRRSVVTELPERARNAAIAARVDAEVDDLRVESVTVNDDGTAQITLNRKTSESIDVIWFMVSGPGGDS